MARRLAPTPVKATQRLRAQARARQLPPAPPPPAQNGRALRHGAFSDPRNLPTFPQVLAEVERVIAEGAPWVQATDAFAVEGFAAALTGFHHAEAAFASMTPRALSKKGKALRANTARLRVINEMARDLGLTPAGRVRLGLQAARTAAIRVTPVKSDERALEVAEILAQARALPPSEGDTPKAVDQTPDLREAEVVPLHDANANGGDK